MKVYIIVIALLISANAFAQPENARRLRNFNLTDHSVGMREFDPVSYFKGKPTKGTEKFKHSYKGITYYFANAENVEAFKKTPDKYEPAYGGWCAFSMANDSQRVKVDPATFKIIDGKVHLFFNFNGNSNLRKWEENEKKFKASADRNWKRIIP